LIIVLMCAIVAAGVTRVPAQVQAPGITQDYVPAQAPPSLPETNPRPPVPQAPGSPSRPSPHSVQAVVKKGEISFNFDDADIFEVIQTVFGDILKVNYMVDPNIKGRVNFRTISPVPRDSVLPIMETLLALNDAGFVLDKDIYKIVPLGMIPGTTPKVFVYPLQNSKATHVASLLQTILSGTGGTRALPVQHRSSSSTPQPRTGASVAVAGNGSLVGPDTRLLADEITNSLIVLATPIDYGFIEETIKKLDTVPRQVLIEVLIAEVTLQDQLQFGLEWLMKTNLNFKLNPLKSGVDLKGYMGQNSDLLPDTAKGISGFSFMATDPDGTVRALLQALASDSKLNVLASPHIIAADNREAKIQIGDQVPIATSQSTQVGTSNSILTTIQYKDTGIILKVKPQINESGLVALEVVQEVSDFSQQKVLGTEQYVISKREASTNLVAQDGQTIIIGGLIKDRSNKTFEGIPFLSKIPILGYLFGSTTDSATRTELLVLLTPHVIRDHEKAAEVTTDYMNRLKGINKDKKIDEFIKNDKEAQ
jgi:type II secretory pathway component GspD/PulD (secretin)